jgi:hypothetical protein
MRPLVEKTAPNATVDDAVLMNSLLDVAGIVGSSRKLVFHPSWCSILDKQRPNSFIGARSFIA